MKIYFVILLLGMLSISCKNTSVDPELDFSGITETNEDGELIGNIDEGDWLKQWNYQDKDINGNPIPISYRVNPAYANPTKRFSTVEFDLPKSDSVKIELDDKSVNKKTVVLSKWLAAGRYKIKVDLLYGESDMKRDESIARLYFTIPTIKTFPIVHGDIKILSK